MLLAAHATGGKQRLSIKEKSYAVLDFCACCIIPNNFLQKK
jgi:hypothetical protein